MPVYVRCPYCKTDQNVKNTTCRSCGRPLPKQGKNYKVVVVHQGRRVQKMVPGSLELAKQIESKIKAELVAGDYYDRRKRSYTLNEVWDRYLPWAKENKKSWRDDEIRWNYLLKERFGKKRLDQITPFEVEKFKLELKKGTNARGKPYAEATILQYLALLRRLFNLAIKWGMFEGENPVSRVKLPRPNNEVTEYLEPEQLKALFEVCQGYHDRQAGNLVLFALATGLRRGELFKLKWSDIDMERGWLRLRDPKGGRDQILPLNNTAMNILQNHPQVSEYVFPGRDGQMRKEFKTAWKRIKKLAGLPEGFRFHGLRHAYASLLASSGQVNPYTLQRLMTHKDFRTTQRYSHLWEASLKQGASVIDKIISGIQGQEQKAKGERQEAKD